MAFKLFSKDSSFLAPEKRQQFLIIVLIVVSLGFLLVLYFGFLRPSPTITSPPPSADVDRGIIGEDLIKKIDFDIDFLKNPNFQDLKIHGEWPLEVGEKGRPNPFLPY